MFWAARGLADGSSKEYQPAFAPLFCAQFLELAQLKARTEIRKGWPFRLYSRTESYRLAERRSQKELALAQYESLNDDQTYFENFQRDANRIFEAAFKSARAVTPQEQQEEASFYLTAFVEHAFATKVSTAHKNVLQAYFDTFDNFNPSLIDDLVRILGRQLVLSEQMVRFHDAYATLGDNSVLAGSRPISNREQVLIASAFADRSDRVHDEKQECDILQRLTEKSAKGRLPKFLRSADTAKALADAKKLLKSESLPLPFRQFLEFYLLFLSNYELPPAPEFPYYVHELQSWLNHSH